MRERIRQLRSESVRVPLDYAQLKRVVERLSIRNSLEDAEEIRIAPAAGVLARSIPGGSIKDCSSILVNMKRGQVRLADADQVITTRTDMPDCHVDFAGQRALHGKVVLHYIRALQIEVYGLDHRQDVARIFR